MEYSSDMILNSPSGFALPFKEEYETEAVKLFGEQEDGSFYPALEVTSNNYPLEAIADGIVSGIGSDSEGGYIVTSYGQYQVGYHCCTGLYKGFGDTVSPGEKIADSGDRLMMEVRFQGESVDPLEFIKMIISNMKMIESQGRISQPEFATMRPDIPTRYDDHMDDIENLMLRHFKGYFSDTATGKYQPSERNEARLRNLYSQLFPSPESNRPSPMFEEYPSLANPCGMGQAMMPLAVKMLDILITDFMAWLFTTKGIKLKGCEPSDEDIKKKK